MASLGGEEGSGGDEICRCFFRGEGVGEITGSKMMGGAEDEGRVEGRSRKKVGGEEGGGEEETEGEMMGSKGIGRICVGEVKAGEATGGGEEEYSMGSLTKDWEAEGETIGSKGT